VSVQTEAPAAWPPGSCPRCPLYEEQVQRLKDRVQELQMAKAQVCLACFKRCRRRRQCPALLCGQFSVKLGRSCSWSRCSVTGRGAPAGPGHCHGCGSCYRRSRCARGLTGQNQGRD
jgi:hypothetical protein